MKSESWSNKPAIFGELTGNRTRIDCLPVLAYIDNLGASLEKRLLWLPAVFPSETVFYQDDVTAVRLRLPGVFARNSANLPAYQKDVRLRFRPSPGSTTQEVCGVVTSIKVTKSANPMANDAQIQVIFSGKGSALKINNLLEGLKRDSCFESVSHDYEYQKTISNQMGQVVGIAYGPRRNSMEPVNQIERMLTSIEDVKCCHRINAELMAYFDAEPDSVAGLKMILDNFGTDEVLARMAEQRTEAELERIRQKERERIERVANSLKRRRVIVVRQIDEPEPPQKIDDLIELVDTHLPETKPVAGMQAMIDALSKVPGSALAAAKAFETFGSIFKHK